MKLKNLKLDYEDTFLFEIVTMKFKEEPGANGLDNPFKYNDGDELLISVQDEVMVGIGQRQFQRDRLYNNRGKVIIIGGKKHKSLLIGRYDKVKCCATLFVTEILKPEEIKIVRKLQKHLTKNNITTIIDIDEKKRFRKQLRQSNGDRIQRLNIPTGHATYECNDDE